MIYMQSTSAATGEMDLTVYFNIDTDPDTAEVQVNNRVSLALPELPDTVRNTGVRVQKRSPSILMLIGIYSPDGRYDEKYVGNYANLYVLDALKRVPGANQAQIMGLPDLAMRLWLQPDRMASLQITPSDIQTRGQRSEPAIRRRSTGSVADRQTRRNDFPGSDARPVLGSARIRKYYFAGRSQGHGHCAPQGRGLRRGRVEAVPVAFHSQWQSVNVYRRLPAARLQCARGGDECAQVDGRVEAILSRGH